MAKTTPKQVWRLLEKTGLMTMTPSASAPKVPALVPLVAGEHVRGSWWGHPKGKEIYAVATEIDEDEGVLSVKLLDGKVTFVDRRLFAPLLRCVGDAAWYDATLGRAKKSARQLRAKLVGDAVVAYDQPPPPLVRRDLAELESLLLVTVTSVHTAKGTHAPRVESWEHWAERVGAKPAKGTRAAALAELEAAAGASIPALRHGDRR